MDKYSPKNFHEFLFVKSVHIWSFYGPCFPAFELNTDRKNFEYGHFSRSAYLHPNTYQNNVTLIQKPIN